MRLKFEGGEQRSFKNNILLNESLSLRSLSRILKINYSTLKNFYREQRLISSKVLNKLCEKYNLEFPKKHIISILPDNWGCVKGGKKGIQIILHKHKNKLQEWRRKGGKNSSLSNKSVSYIKKVELPKLNEKFSEFIGILLGDGTIHKYFFSISGDSRYDKKYFEYIYNLVYKLFKVKPCISFNKRGNQIYLRLCSIKICNYLNKKFRINFGDKIKNKTTIPKQILNNKKLFLSCLRGLIDTDGCIGKGGDRLSLTFTSYNSKLIEDVHLTSKKLNLFTYKYEKDIGTDSFPKICNYFNKVGSSNFRHIVRFLERYYNKKLLYKQEVLNYYNKYKDILIPYKGPVV